MSDDFAKGFVEALHKTSIEIKKYKEIPKTMVYVLKGFIDHINQYCYEILVEYFKEGYTEIIKDWDYNILTSNEFKEKILESSWVVDIDMNFFECPEEKGCSKIPNGLERDAWLKKERKKRCRGCFMIQRDGDIEQYKRAIDVGITSFKKYINGLKEMNLLREEYLTPYYDIDLDLLIKSIPNPKRASKQTILKEFGVD